MCCENEKVLCRGQSSRHRFMHNLLKTYPDSFIVFSVKRRFHDVNITDIKKKGVSGPCEGKPEIVINISVSFFMKPNL